MRDHLIHYFVVAGYIDAGGRVRLGDDPDVADSVLDGTIWDENALEWRVAVSSEDKTHDDLILVELRRRLLAGETADAV